MISRAQSRTASQLVGVLAATAVAATTTAFAVIPAGAATRTTVTRLVAGTNVHDNDGRVWNSDRRYAHGGRVVRLARAVTGSGSPTFRSVRVGSFGYRIPVQPGTYTVRVMTTRLASASGRGSFVFRAADTTVHVPARSTSVRAVTVKRVVTVRGGQLVLTFGGRHGAAVTGVSVTARRGQSSGRHRTAPTTKPSQTPTTKPSGTPSATATPNAGPTTSVTSSPTPSPTSASPSPSESASSVSPESFGAKGDGSTDDTAALQRAFDGANGRTIALRSGATYAFTSVLHLRATGLRVTGAATLLALDQEHSDVWLDAAGITLDGGLTVRTKTTTQRWGTWDQMGVRLGPYTGITLRNVNVVGSAAAGIYVGGSDHFVLDHVTVKDTRADGIHMTAGAAYGTVTNPVVTNSGDDGVAIVSYKQDGTPCHDITVTSPRVYGTTWGRGLSVVGGRNVTETDIYVADSSAAGIYLAAEGNPWYTAAPANVTISGGTILRANRTTTVEHGAVLVLSGESDVVPDTVTVKGLAIRDTAVSKRNLGVITYGSPPRNVLFQDITITGGTAPAYEGNTVQSAYRLRSVTKDGVRVADQG